ncbi:MAG: hypothetical protein RIQ73_677 [Actinomycetota bacterium]
MNAFYLILGSEGALSDRAINKLTAELKELNCEITNLFAAETIVGDIADALAPSLFSERRALILRDLQDLPEENKDEITRYLTSPDETMTVVFVHKGGVKGKALLDAIKKVKPEIITCEPLKKEAEKEQLNISDIEIDYSNEDDLVKLLTLHERGLEYNILEHFEVGYSSAKDRVVIPVRDAQYKAVGFIGRAIKSEQEPRYLYNKGFKRADVLFNIQNSLY